VTGVVIDSVVRSFGLARRSAPIHVREGGSFGRSVVRLGSPKRADSCARRRVVRPASVCRGTSQATGLGMARRSAPESGSGGRPIGYVAVRALWSATNAKVRRMTWSVTTSI
jgi:hypothetical protein